MARGVCRWCGAGSVVVGRRAREVEGREWGAVRSLCGSATGNGAVWRERGACRECERGESFVPTVCGAGEGQGGDEWAVWREGRAWEGRGVKREEERWGGERGQ